MSQKQPVTAEPAQTAPFHRAFNAMLGFGRDMLARVQAALSLSDTSYLPARFARAPLCAEQRLTRTLDWIVALARTLAGDRTWLIVPTYAFPRFPAFPSLTADLRRQIGLPALPPRTQAQKDAAHLWYVKKVFATQPTAKIAARLARRLGIAEGSDAWPAELLTVTQTPAQAGRSGVSPPNPRLGAAPPDPHSREDASPAGESLDFATPTSRHGRMVTPPPCPHRS